MTGLIQETFFESFPRITGADLNESLSDFEDVRILIDGIDTNDAKMFLNHFKTEANKKKSDKKAGTNQNGQERTELIQNDSNNSHNIERSIELSSMRDDDNEEERIAKLIQRQTDNNDSKCLFKINIQTSSKDTKTLDTKCSKDTTIKRVKEIIMDELKKDNIDNIELQYKGNNMDNDSILEDYNIIDSKHLITVVHKVKDSSMFAGFRQIARAARQSVFGAANNNARIYITLIYELPNKSTHSIYSIHKNSTISDVKIEIGAAEHLFITEDVQLYYEGNLLKDDYTLDSYKIFHNTTITVKYVKLMPTPSIVFIICSIVFDIIILLIESLVNKGNQKCINPDTGNYYGNPINIHAFIMFFSIVKLLCTIVIPGLLVKVRRNNILKLRFYWIFTWCIYTIGAVIGLIMLFNDSIPKGCLQSKSGYLLIIWVIIYNLVGIPVFIVKILWHLCCDAFDLVREYKSALIASLVLVANFALDWLPFFAYIQDWSSNSCITDDKHQGMIMDIKTFLLTAWIAKLLYTTGLITSEMSPAPEFKCIIHGACVFLQFFVGLFGILVAYAFGGGISNPCLGSNLGILLQIWSFIQIIIAIGTAIVLIKHLRSKESTCIIILMWSIGFVILILLCIPILTLVAGYASETPKCYEVIKNPIEITQYLSIMGWSDIIFKFIMLNIAVFAWTPYQHELDEYWLLVPVIITFMYAIFSIIIGGIGLNTIEQDRLTSECLTSSFIGIMFQVNSYYHTICGALYLIGCCLAYCAFADNQIIAGGMAGILSFGLFLNGILAVAQPSWNGYNDTWDECPIYWMETFLKIGGWAEIIVFVFVGIAACTKHQYAIGSVSCILFLIFGWSIIGIVMYHTNYFSDECRIIKIVSHMIIYSYTNVILFILLGCAGAAVAA